ncbi:cytochrome c-type biogenesis protein CcmI [Candidatus Endolissoclinum faulkneri L2]|uniref:Cytochrome c-type biogenesis protein CcmI n=2 Tax=Candidatus Endolissoclinum faulkneri TaxID=1263979 RepID=K7ZCM7_9PROT|nr:cytochrome c-type biogenesis protein CcmI [Candidatus Endolissoclinum faulkneri L2]
MFIVVLVLIIPLLRQHTASIPRAAYELAVLKNQFAEIESDVVFGVISKEEANANRIEVERCMLAEINVADTFVPLSTNRRYDFILAALIVIFLPLTTSLLYLSVGNPGMPDLPLSIRSEEIEADIVQFVQKQRNIMEMARNLENRLSVQSNDLDAWMLLGRARSELGNFKQAIVAFRQAIKLGGKSEAMGEMAETMVRIDHGIVSAKTYKIFQNILKIVPGDPRARYYLALAALQAGDVNSALRQWLLLVADTPVDKNWVGNLLKRIEEVANDNKIDLAAIKKQILLDRIQ